MISKQTILLSNQNITQLNISKYKNPFVHIISLASQFVNYIYQSNHYQICYRCHYQFINISLSSISSKRPYFKHDNMNHCQAIYCIWCSYQIYTQFKQNQLSNNNDSPSLQCCSQNNSKLVSKLQKFLIQNCVLCGSHCKYQQRINIGGQNRVMNVGRQCYLRLQNKLRIWRSKQQNKQLQQIWRLSKFKCIKCRKYKFNIIKASYYEKVNRICKRCSNKQRQIQLQLINMLDEIESIISGDSVQIRVNNEQIEVDDGYIRNNDQLDEIDQQDETILYRNRQDGQDNAGQNKMIIQQNKNNMNVKQRVNIYKREIIKQLNKKLQYQIRQQQLLKNQNNRQQQIRMIISDKNNNIINKQCDRNINQIIINNYMRLNSINFHHININKINQYIIQKNNIINYNHLISNKNNDVD